MEDRSKSGAQVQTASDALEKPADEESQKANKLKIQVRVFRFGLL
jgi:hypothetical protein